MKTPISGFRRNNAYRAAAIADDSGLAVDFLDGAPGVYTARTGAKG
jgi:inosine/xanthosine triphosphate pyrophosphatase family protein